MLVGRDTKRPRGECCLGIHQDNPRLRERTILSSPPPRDKLRFRFAFPIESVGFERDAVHHPLSVVVSRRGKVARTAPVPTSQ
eukprot:COSAG06_NODE_51625_length_311_cov_0.448113_1_plen_82_part_10